MGRFLRFWATLLVVTLCAGCHSGPPKKSRDREPDRVDDAFRFHEAEAPSHFGR